MSFETRLDRIGIFSFFYLSIYHDPTRKIWKKKKKENEWKKIKISRLKKQDCEC